MKVLLQYWRQRGGALLISLCLNRYACRQVRHALLFAQDGVIPEGEPLWVDLAPYATATTRIEEEGYIFISEAELKLYVTFFDP